MTLDIEAAGLELRYGAVTALHDLSFRLAGGRIYGLLGRNGPVSRERRIITRPGDRSATDL